jgi:hypothetical protein
MIVIGARRISNQRVGDKRESLVISSAEHSMMQGLSCPRLDADTCSTPVTLPVRHQADPSPPTLKPQEFILIKGLLLL